ncbi:crotonase/enoyl-CoA hydratase family protein [Paracoccus sp. CPCC 101403]|uniref:Crotonase/enoyl-CoA hydratase family protein n=1 Tax=Paracoccus broussonetiae TaxID=3075834 RepID=A0ABU3EBP4_9RHOB|nr:crotonase/enoyl-CoA hydratase family protein [Paracoccus sp. CPCC 101403]MDT1061650.1 crotonase/enoyl-CoA hydratase family protein [Paracoccus sp. CPCC 101403]
MMQTIRIEVDPRGVAHLWLARPDKHNALSAEMIHALTEAAALLADDSAVRVVVLAAEGKSFCAGGDLGWMQDQMRANADTRRAAARELAGMLNALNTLPKPLIGRVQGNAFGGGIGMISVCDVAISVPEARFALTETRLGLIPATIGPYVVARLGEARARRVFMSGRAFGADEAMRFDLVARIAGADQLDAAVEAEVAPYLSCAPGAVAAAKRLVRDLGPRLDQQVIDHTVEALVRVWEGDEAPEGIAAFFDKRKPHWQV